MKDEKDRRAIARAALLLAASRSDNCHNQAFRLLVQRWKHSARHDDLDVASADLAAEALREISRLLPDAGRAS